MKKKINQVIHGRVTIQEGSLSRKIIIRMVSIQIVVKNQKKLNKIRDLLKVKLYTIRSETEKERKREIEIA